MGIHHVIWSISLGNGITLGWAKKQAAAKGPVLFRICLLGRHNVFRLHCGIVLCITRYVIRIFNSFGRYARRGKGSSYQCEKEDGFGKRMLFFRTQLKKMCEVVWNIYLEFNFLIIITSYFYDDLYALQHFVRNFETSTVSVLDIGWIPFHVQTRNSGKWYNVPYREPHIN